MTLSCSSTDFENDSDFRPSLQMLSQIQVMSLNALSVTLADNVQLSLPGVIHTAASHPSSIPRPQRPTAGSEDAQCGQSAFTEDVRHNRPPYPVIRVKQPALT